MTEITELCAYLLIKNASGTYNALVFTQHLPLVMLPSGFGIEVLPIYSYDTNITGNLSNNLITYDKPASIPLNALIVNDMNVSSDNKSGCFSTNIRIGNDTIKVDGRLRNLSDLWNVYAFTKWNNNQKEFVIGKYTTDGTTSTILDRKMFAIQIADLNWSINSGMGEEIDYTLQLKVVDQKSNNPLNR